MRKIIFRGKDINGRWHYGQPFIIGNTHSSISYFDLKDTLVNVWVENETLGQYTGLQDRNKKPIYEGDILVHKCISACNDNKAISYRTIVWSNGGYKMVNKQCCRTNDISEYSNGKILSSWEVVGNIHDNPELCY